MLTVAGIHTYYDTDHILQGVSLQVTEGQVVGIIEAMKLFNEIECDVSGKIVKILVENAQPIEYGKPLFLIQKS